MRKLWKREVLREVDSWACRPGRPEDDDDDDDGDDGKTEGEGSAGVGDGKGSIRGEEGGRSEGKVMNKMDEISKEHNHDRGKIIDEEKGKRE